MFNLFVYGTLRKDQCNYSLIKDDIKRIKKATYNGHLYHLPFGYPAVVEGNGRVAGELFTFEDNKELLARLDELEGYHGPGMDNEYERVKGTVILESGKRQSCQLYVYPPSKQEWLQSEGVLVSKGDWTQWMAGEEDIYYFAYGSCMNRKDFARTVESFEVLGKVTLHNYRIAFTHFSHGRNGGVADIVPYSGHDTEGVLYQFPYRYLTRLDQREGVHLGVYKRKIIEVKWKGKSMPVLTYEVVNKQESLFYPSEEYSRLIIEGSDLLSPTYQSWLKKYIQERKE